MDDGGYTRSDLWSTRAGAWLRRPRRRSRRNTGRATATTGRRARWIASRPVDPDASRLPRLLSRGGSVRAMGRQAAADRSRMGGRGRAGIRPTRRARNFRGATSPRRRRPQTSTSFRSTPRLSAPTTQSVATRVLRHDRRCLGMDVERLQPVSGFRELSRTRSTRRYSSGPSTRCCAADRGRRGRRDPEHLPQLGLSDPAADFQRTSAARATPEEPIAPPTRGGTPPYTVHVARSRWSRDVRDG